MGKLHDYKLVFCISAHGKRYWRIADDDQVYTDKVASVLVQAENENQVIEAFESLLFPLESWENGEIDIDDFDFDV